MSYAIAFFLMLIVTATHEGAQADVPVGEEIILIEPYCAYDGTRIVGKTYIFPPDKVTEKIMKQIAEYAPQHQFTLRASNVPNALALMPNKLKLILYSQTFAKTRAEKIAVLAHEMAHHQLNHVLPGAKDPRHKEELQADRFAGIVLQGEGFSLEEARKAVEGIVQQAETDRHPARDARISAVVNGWNSNQAVELVRQIAGKSDRLRVSQESGILARIRLDNDEYFLTADKDVIKVTPKGKIMLMGQRDDGVGPEQYIHKYTIDDKIYWGDPAGGIWSSEGDGTRYNKRGHADYYTNILDRPSPREWLVQGTVKGTVTRVEEKEYLILNLPDGQEVKLYLGSGSKTAFGKIAVGDKIEAQVTEKGQIKDVQTMELRER